MENSRIPKRHSGWTLANLLTKRNDVPLQPSVVKGNSTRRWRQQLVDFIQRKKEPTTEDLLVMKLDQALKVLETNSLETARAMELRYFAHLDTQTIAIKMGCAIDRIRRKMIFGRAVILREMKK